jgi:5-methylthioadenosine/S-adenosylhomocysteine deaminase
MLECGINVGIGTDGPASNNDLDMFEEMRLAALLPKGVTGDPTVVPARTALLMATRMGAAALHIDNMTGALEQGKRADLILLELRKTHSQPRFRREENTIYSQIVYSAKASDVTDVMVNGKWLMTNQKLLTLNEESLVNEAQVFAKKVDDFFVPRERSVLTKLISIGGAHEGEHYEVQAKGRVESRVDVSQCLKNIGLEVVRMRHYKEFDTYFLFDDSEQGYVRYREDEFVESDGSVSQARYRLTHVGPAREERFESGVVLSRSRYIASAQHSLRFYREYFRPSREITIEKDRMRWLVNYKGTEFFVNFDELKSPNLGCFLEVKSRTWSRHDAQQKAQHASDLLFLLGVKKESLESRDYLEMQR